MYTIIMNNDKSLTASIKTTLYQREKLVDKIQFLLPLKYSPKDLDICDCTIVLKYTDQGNVAHAIELIPDEELYKEHVRCELDVDLRFTRFAGDIIMYLDFLKLNSDNGIYENVLTSGETTITIQPRSDWFAYCADESLDIINRTMLELKAKQEAQDLIAATYENSKADSIIKTIDGSDIKVQLTSNGNLIGDEIIIGDTDEEGVNVTIFESEDSPSIVENDEDIVEF